MTPLKAIARCYVFQIRTRLRLVRLKCGTLARQKRIGPLARLVFTTPLDILLFSIRFLGWASAACWSRTVPPRGSERCCVILLSFRRPFNMELLARAALRCGFVDKVILHNNDATPLSRWVNIADARLEIRELPKPVPHGIRWELAWQSAYDYFIAIDDDVFLHPRQISSLFERLIEHPEVPHGITGEAYRETTPGKYKVELNVTGEDVPVDHVTEVYAFSRSHIAEARRLAAASGRGALMDVGNGEDIILSFSGAGKPRIHEVGRVLRCFSAWEVGVATSMSMTNFLSERIELHRNLMSIKAT